MARGALVAALAVGSVAALLGSRAHAQAPDDAAAEPSVPPPEDAAAEPAVPPPVPAAYLEPVAPEPPAARIATAWPDRIRRRSYLRLLARGGPATIHLADATGWSELCTAPCVASLPRGRVRFALSSGGGAPLAVEGEPFLVDLDETLWVHHEDHGRLRGTGLVLVVAGLALAAGLGGGMLAARDEAQAAGRVVESAMSVVGAVIGFAGGGIALIGGAVLATTPDVSRVERAPPEADEETSDDAE